MGLIKGCEGVAAVFVIWFAFWLVLGLVLGATFGGSGRVVTKR